MARGTATVFNEAPFDAWKGVHTLPGDTLKLAIVDNTLAPTAADATPRWADYSANEVTAAGNYIAGGIALTGVTFTMEAGIPTIKASDVVIAIHASGFLNGYWGLLVNTSATNSEVIGFWEMDGPVSEQAGPVTFEFPSGIVAELPANVAA